MVNGNNKAPFAGTLIIENYLMVQRNKINKALEAIQKAMAKRLFSGNKKKMKEKKEKGKKNKNKIRKRKTTKKILAPGKIYN